MGSTRWWRRRRTIRSLRKCHYCYFLSTTPNYALWHIKKKVSDWSASERTFQSAHKWPLFSFWHLSMNTSLGFPLLFCLKQRCDIVKWRIQPEKQWMNTVAIKSIRHPVWSVTCLTKLWFRQIIILGKFDGNLLEILPILDHFLKFLLIFAVMSVTFRQIEKTCDLWPTNWFNSIIGTVWSVVWIPYK